MRFPKELLTTSLSGMLGPSGLSREEIATLRRRAWIEQGILIVSPRDHRLTRSETIQLNQLADRLYGSGGAS